MMLMLGELKESDGEVMLSVVGMLTVMLVMLNEESAVLIDSDVEGSWIEVDRTDRESDVGEIPVVGSWTDVDGIEIDPESMFVSSDEIDREEIDSDVKAVFTEIVVLNSESDSEGSCVLKDPVIEVSPVLMDGTEVGNVRLMLGRLVGNEGGLLQLRPVLSEIEVLGMDSEIEAVRTESDIEVLGTEIDNEVGKPLVLIEIEVEGKVSEGMLKDNEVEGKFVGSDRLVDGRLMLKDNDVDGRLVGKDKLVDGRLMLRDNDVEGRLVGSDRLVDGRVTLNEGTPIGGGVTVVVKVQLPV